MNTFSRLAFAVSGIPVIGGPIVVAAFTVAISGILAAELVKQCVRMHTGKCFVCGDAPSQLHGVCWSCFCAAKKAERTEPVSREMMS